MGVYVVRERYSQLDTVCLETTCMYVYFVKGSVEKIEIRAARDWLVCWFVLGTNIGAHYIQYSTRHWDKNSCDGNF